MSVEPDSPFHLVVNPNYLKNLNNIARLCNPNEKFPIKGRIYSGKFGIVTRENMGNRLDPISVAVKRIKNFGMTGFEYFDAMTLLQSEGVPCASPVAATRDRYISRWVSGLSFYYATLEQVSQNSFNEYFDALVERVEDLESEGRWNEAWFLDSSEDSFILRDVNSSNPIERFTAIDPVYSKGEPEFHIFPT